VTFLFMVYASTRELNVSPRVLLQPTRGDWNWIALRLTAVGSRFLPIPGRGA
jgi:hypothetical protein